ncbi:MAG TPA: response regulator transcription factor [Stackebrandtia sp.]|uniref:response regulator transcription factor n=1 Tax=Stackebrandtia sp. TaxID=2023065 RepID=UPI002D453F0F|nr:response regulator transcription factor [Stackebrandtia sp.]HZE39987.1 response regulator transcription factor [Stackebrandtia sp.]
MTSPADPSVHPRREGGPARLLVVEDEELLSGMLLDALTFTGYDVHLARSGTAAIEAIDALHPDLVVLDVNLPDLSGFAVATRMRAAFDRTGVIFLTARDNPADVRDGFLAGGDDYVTKPFRLEELRLRIDAVLRRTADVRDAAADRLAVDNLVLDGRSHQVWRGGEEIDLSPTEFRLLRHLIAGVDRVSSRTELLQQVWGIAFDTDTSLVETYISYLRRKLETHGPRLIHTVRGVGYVLRTPRGQDS